MESAPGGSSKNFKIRIKIADGRNDPSFSFSVPGENPTIREIRAAVSAALQVRSVTREDYNLSLNGSDPLDDSSETAKDAGIVSGDRIFVIFSAQPQAEMQIVQERPPPPLHLEDSTSSQVPRNFITLIRTFSSDVSSSQDLIAVLLHYAMLERGFLPVLHNEMEPTRCNKYSEVPTEWKDKEGGYVYYFSYFFYHPRVLDQVVDMRIIEMDNVLVVNSKCRTNENVHCMSIKAEDYVEDHACHEVAGKFKNLSEFSRKFSKTVAALLQDCRGDAGSLVNLPETLILSILKHLNVESLVAFSKCCTVFASIAATQSLWKRLYFRDFKSSSLLHPSDWKEEYKKHYLCLRRSRIPPLEFPYPVIPDSRLFVPERIPVPLSGVLGGPEDLYPGGIVPGRRGVGGGGMRIFPVRPQGIPVPGQPNPDPDPEGILFNPEIPLRGPRHPHPRSPFGGGFGGGMFGGPGFL